MLNQEILKGYIDADACKCFDCGGMSIFRKEKETVETENGKSIRYCECFDCGEAWYDIIMDNNIIGVMDDEFRGCFLNGVNA